MLKSKCLSGLVLSMAVIAISPAAHAQSATPPGPAASRMEIRMERDEFLKLHRYDDESSEWLPIAPSTNELRRAEVKAARNQYLSTNRWHESNDAFVLILGAPRDMSTMTREEVKMERMQFARNYTWDNGKSAWVMKPMRNAR